MTRADARRRPAALALALCVLAGCDTGRATLASRDIAALGGSAAPAADAEQSAATPTRVVPPAPIRLFGRNLATLPPKTPGVPRVLFVGDSIAAGFGLPAGAEPYPSLIADRLAREDGVAIEVLNGGIYGFTTSGGLVLEELGSLQPDVIVIELGGNDYLLHLPLERTRKNLHEMVQAGRGMGARVLLVGVRLPAFLRSTDRGQQFDALYADVASELSVPLVPDMYQDTLGNPRFMQADSIHPTAEGQMVVADSVLAGLRPLVLQVLGR